MELILVDKNNYLKAIEIQNSIFPKEDSSKTPSSFSKLIPGLI